MSDLKINIQAQNSDENNINPDNTENLEELVEPETVTDEKNNKKVDNISPSALISLTKKIEDTKEKDLENANENLKKFEENEKKLSEIKLNEKRTEEEEGNQEIFENYDSDFHKNEKSILKKIVSMRYMPHTRVGFVITIISITAIILIGLGIFDPKNHSLSNYKANILLAVSKLSNNNPEIIIPVNSGSLDINSGSLDVNSGSLDINSGSLDINSGSLDVNSGSLDVNSGSLDVNSGSLDVNSGSLDINSGSLDVNSGSLDVNSGSLDDVKNELIKEKWLSINPEVIILANGDKIYSYKGNTYNKEGLQNKLKIEIEEMIDKKIKEHLSQIYLK